MPKPKLPFKQFEWNPALAYAVGLIATDGNLSKDGRHITMRSSEKTLLEIFGHCLNLRGNKIAKTIKSGYTLRPCYRLQFSNVQFYNWLLSIGITPAKTYTIGEIKIPDEYFRDFLRGHLDGDGSISTYRDYYNTFKDPKYVYTRVWVRFISVSLAHMNWLQGKIHANFGLMGHLNRSKIGKQNQKVPMNVLKFGKKESLKLLPLLYYHPAVPCLLRKREKAEKILSMLHAEINATAAPPKMSLG